MIHFLWKAVQSAWISRWQKSLMLISRRPSGTQTAIIHGKWDFREKFLKCTQSFGGECLGFFGWNWRLYLQNMANLRRNTFIAKICNMKTLLIRLRRKKNSIRQSSTCPTCPKRYIHLIHHIHFLLMTMIRFSFPMRLFPQYGAPRNTSRHSTMHTQYRGTCLIYMSPILIKCRSLQEYPIDLWQHSFALCTEKNCNE